MKRWKRKRMRYCRKWGSSSWITLFICWKYSFYSKVSSLFPYYHTLLIHVLDIYILHLVSSLYNSILHWIGWNMNELSYYLSCDKGNNHCTRTFHKGMHTSQMSCSSPSFSNTMANLNWIAFHYTPQCELLICSMGTCIENYSYGTVGVTSSSVIFLSTLNSNSSIEYTHMFVRTMAV